MQLSSAICRVVGRFHLVCDAAKSNAVYEVLETVTEIILAENQSGVWKEELIEVSYGKQNDRQKRKLRRVCYLDERRCEYVFISNNMEIAAEEIALIYKKRWGIELLFKKLKQNFWAALILRRKRKRDQDAGVVHVDRPTFTDRFAEQSIDQKGLFNRRRRSSG